jgi:hypothetical protein
MFGEYLFIYFEDTRYKLGEFQLSDPSSFHPLSFFL